MNQQIAKTDQLRKSFCWENEEEKNFFERLGYDKNPYETITSTSKYPADNAAYQAAANKLKRITNYRAEIERNIVELDKEIIRNSTIDFDLFPEFYKPARIPTQKNRIPRKLNDSLTRKFTVGILSKFDNDMNETVISRKNKLDIKVQSLDYRYSVLHTELRSLSFSYPDNQAVRKELISHYHEVMEQNQMIEHLKFEIDDCICELEELDVYKYFFRRCVDLYDDANSSSNTSFESNVNSMPSNNNKESLLNIHYVSCSNEFCKKSSHIYNPHSEMNSLHSENLRRFDTAIEKLMSPDDFERLGSPDHMKKVFEFIDHYNITQVEELNFMGEAYERIKYMFKKNENVEKLKAVANKLNEKVVQKELLLSNMTELCNSMDSHINLESYRKLFNFGNIDVSNFDSILKSLSPNICQIYSAIYCDTVRHLAVIDFEELASILKQIELFIDKIYLTLNQIPLQIRKCAFKQQLLYKNNKSRIESVKKYERHRAELYERIEKEAKKPIRVNKGRRLVTRSAPKTKIKKIKIVVPSKNSAIYNYSDPFQD